MSPRHASLDQLRAARFHGLRIVGDVHGDAEAFAHACEGARELRLFVLQLGDLTDHGPDSPAALRQMFDLLDEEAGLFILGNHDHKLRRALTGAQVRTEPEGLGRTLRQVGAAHDSKALIARAVEEIARAPAWLRLGCWFFVHGAYHDAMLHRAPPQDAGARKPQGPVTRALFGEVTGRMQPDGFPKRIYRWVDRVPPEFTIYCGHDCRSRDGRPFVQEGALGGRAMFLDTGAGKGGHLSWIDLEL